MNFHNQSDDEPRAVKNAKRVSAAAPLLFNMRGGYYCAAPDGESDDLIFIRLSTFKARAGASRFSESHRYDGCLLIQTQHGDELITRYIINPSGKVHRADHSAYASKVIEALFMSLADEDLSQRRYASKLGKCFRCAKALTDQRSRHYGIGPECEKVWPDVITYVDEMEGPWVPTA